MENAGGTSASSGSNIDRLKVLYPFVNEEETPLPRCWSSKDKYNFIGLSQNNLRVHYKGNSLICRKSVVMGTDSVGCSSDDLFVRPGRVKLINM